jgi:VanZ family protein
LVAAIGLTGSIFATLELAPKVWAWVLPRAGDQIPELAVALAGCLCATLVARAWSNGPGEQRTSRMLLLTVAFASAGLALTTVLANTTMAAKVHLVQYGVLAWWFLNAVRTERGPVLATLAVVLALGALDEGIQHLLPSRYFDVRDILGNWWATGTGAAAWLAASRASPLSRQQGSTQCPEQ